MRPHGLIDTGAIVALLNSNDPWHGACAKAFRGLSLPLATTTAVLTEVFYHLAGHSQSLDTAWGFLLRSGSIAIAGIDADDLRQVERLMKRYLDRPMDFADATLVRVAERECLSQTYISIALSKMNLYILLFWKLL